MRLPDTYMWFRTRRSRKLYSAFGLALWLTCCAFAFAHNDALSTAFFVLTLAWMLTIFAVLCRDHWENRR